MPSPGLLEIQEVAYIGPSQAPRILTNMTVGQLLVSQIALQSGSDVIMSAVGADSVIPKEALVNIPNNIVIGGEFSVTSQGMRRWTKLIRQFFALGIHIAMTSGVGITNKRDP